MRIRVNSFSIIFLLIHLTTLESSLLAQSGTDAKLQELKRQRDEISQMVDKWERNAKVIISLTVLIGVLGVAISIAQKFEFSRQKITTVAIGSLISLLTLFNTTFFEQDHRMYLKTAGEARLILDDISLELAEDITEYDETAKEAWENSIRTKMREITSMNVKLIASSTMETISLVPVAFAQTQQSLPAWVTDPPSDEFFFNFVGIGQSSSVEMAKEMSFHNAQNIAVNYFMTELEGEEKGAKGFRDNEAVAKALVKSAEVTRNYFTRDPSDGLYRHYTLLTLNKNFLEAELRFKAIEQSVDPSKAVSVAEVLKSKGSPDKTYYERRRETYDWVLGQAQGSLGEEQYERFQTARKLRFNGDYETAAGMLEEVVAQSPGFYFGWYNLGLAYDQLHDTVKADLAYKRAAILEPSLAVRDASIYNTYGYFLYRLKKYPEAVVQLEKALEIDPDHPKARNTLRIVRDR